MRSRRAGVTPDLRTQRALQPGICPAIEEPVLSVGVRSQGAHQLLGALVAHRMQIHRDPELEQLLADRCVVDEQLPRRGLVETRERGQYVTLLGFHVREQAMIELHPERVRVGRPDLHRVEQPGGELLEPRVIGSEKRGERVLCGHSRLRGHVHDALQRPCRDACGIADAMTRGMLLPAISSFMTREPYTLPSSATAAAARDMMETHLIRHLPILDGRHLRGVVALSQLEALAHIPGVDLQHIEIARIMAPAVTVWGESSLVEVAARMKEKRCECVVVLGGQGVEGIFTATDALGALSHMLQRATDHARAFV